MKLAFVIAVSVTGLAASAQTPTPAQQAKALQDLAPAHYDQQPLVRKVRCKRLGHPTEFSCSYEEQQGAQWRKYSVYAAIDGDGWVLIDEPALVVDGRGKKL